MSITGEECLELFVRRIFKGQVWTRRNGCGGLAREQSSGGNPIPLCFTCIYVHPHPHSPSTFMLSIYVERRGTYTIWKSRALAALCRSFQVSCASVGLSVHAYSVLTLSHTHASTNFSSKAHFIFHTVHKTDISEVLPATNSNSSSRMADRPRRVECERGEHIGG